MIVSLKSVGGSKELKISIETITPLIAENWLRLNFDRNRNYRRALAEQYAADIVQGKWRLSDQSITFDIEAHLVNGRHRLEAVLLADKPIISLVIRNLPLESVMVLDGGLKRTTDDAFRIAGLDAPRGCGSTIRRMILGGRTSIGRRITDHEVKEYLDVYDTSVRFAHRTLPSGRFATVVNRAVVARAAIKKMPHTELEKFAEALTTGMMVPGQEAAILLRNYILEKEELGGGSRATRLYTMAESALHAFLQGDRSRKLKPVMEELFPIQALDVFPRANGR